MRLDSTILVQKIPRSRLAARGDAVGCCPGVSFHQVLDMTWHIASAASSDYDQLVGDYANPTLQPWAAEVVKKFGEQSLAGIVYGNPSNQCWPMPMPFIYKQF